MVAPVTLPNLFPGLEFGYYHHQDTVNLPDPTHDSHLCPQRDLSISQRMGFRSVERLVESVSAALEEGPADLDLRHCLPLRLRGILLILFRKRVIGCPCRLLLTMRN